MADNHAANNHGANNHGGARPGAGRKPKALLYGDLAACAEQKVADALPAIMDSLIESAKGGDLAAARYLCDRILGRVATVSIPPAYDERLPMTEGDLEQALRYAEPSASLDALLMDLARI